MDLRWLRVCAENDPNPCVQPLQIAYLAILVVGVVLLALVAARSRTFTTATLVLMPVGIALNIAVGSLVAALKLPIYLDSIGTVLVGVLAGPWAGALTGLLANLIWSILPIAGGGGPVIAFFAPVAGVIGLMAGFWASQGVFRLRADDTRVGRFLALALGVVFAAAAVLVVSNRVGFDFGTPEGQSRSTAIGIGIVALAAAVAWLSSRTVFAFRPNDPRIPRYLTLATAGAAAVIVFALLRLVFAPASAGGYLARTDGSDPTAWHDVDLSRFAMPDPLGLVVVVAVALVAAAGAWIWASKGDRARLFPAWIGGLTTGLVAATISAVIAAGAFGGVTGSGVDALVALYRSLGFSVFGSAFAQGLTSDPLDKTLSYTLVFAILSALPITVRSMFSHGDTTIVE